MRLIDADKLKIKLADELSDALGETDFTDGLHHGLKLAIGLAEETPLADAKPIQRGYWIKVETPHTSPYERNVYKCSECHTHFIAFVDRYRYCPNCGAKMDNRIINNINDDIKTSDDEIIRCKDCKHWFYFWESEKHHCTESDKPLWDCPIREEDDFCSRGERR